MFDPTGFLLDSFWIAASSVGEAEGVSLQLRTQPHFVRVKSGCKNAIDFSPSKLSFFQSRDKNCCFLNLPFKMLPVGTFPLLIGTKMLPRGTYFHFSLFTFFPTFAYLPLTTMRICLSLLSGQELPLLSGTPPNFHGTLLRNVDTHFAVASFGTVVVQQVQLSAMNMALVSVHWIKPERLVCQHDDPCTMFTRSTLASSLHHYIKGTGEIHLGKEQFMTMAAGTWRSVILPEKSGYHSFIDISWSPRFISEMLDNDHAFNQALRIANCDGFPESLLGVPLDMDKHMKHVMGELVQVDFAEKGAETMLRRSLKLYFIAMIDEAIARLSIKKKMRVSDWETIHAARELIEANLHVHLTIPEISMRVGMNEYKLKKLFPRVVGKKIDEYRKYQLCIRAGKRIVEQRDEPLKSFYADAGYTSLSTFIRGFKKLCCCTPGELREDSWDLASITNAADE